MSSPSQSMQSISSMLLPEFDIEIANTRKVLERLPEDKLNWRPHAKSYTMIQLATHLSNIPHWATITMTTEELDIQPPGAPPYKEEACKSVQELLDKVDKSAAAARAAIAAASDDKFHQTWKLLMTERVIFNRSRIAVIRDMIMNHIIHHRAQLGVYLRLNDVPVPAIYGPSADEGTF